MLRGRGRYAEHRIVDYFGFEAIGILKMSVQDIFYRAKPHLLRLAHSPVRHRLFTLMLRGRGRYAEHRIVDYFGFEAIGILKMSVQDIFYRAKPHLLRLAHSPVRHRLFT